jgi:hypothetical protein
MFQGLSLFLFSGCAGDLLNQNLPNHQLTLKMELVPETLENRHILIWLYAWENVIEDKIMLLVLVWIRFIAGSVGGGQGLFFCMTYHL